MLHKNQKNHETQNTQILLPKNQLFNKKIKNLNKTFLGLVTHFKLNRPKIILT
jgi:hypothetical protein